MYCTDLKTLENPSYSQEKWQTHSYRDRERNLILSGPFAVLLSLPGPFSICKKHFLYKQGLMHVQNVLTPDQPALSVQADLDRNF